MKNIAVIFGGNSAEYEVSLISATAVIQVLEKLDYKITKIGITEEGEWIHYAGKTDKIASNLWFSDEHCVKAVPLLNGNGFLCAGVTITPDVIFPVLHGKFGEDGCIQGLFELMQLPYVGCGVTVSALCMNKYLLHRFAKSVGIQSTPALLVSKHHYQLAEISQFVLTHGFPLFVKPNEAGSSKGIEKVHDLLGLQDALKTAWQFGTQAIIQTEVTGVEIGCAILGNEQLIIGECDEIQLTKEFFDYTEKYQMVTTTIQIPAQIPEEVSMTIKKSAETLYRQLGCKGLARIDFFLTEEGQILLNEINTMPGFTSHSRFPTMMAKVGVTYIDIVQKLIELAEKEYANKQVPTIN
ncbi:D-alanine--D-serine ligase [Enterococcus saccharolyticus]|uniref:D-alanine--D-alanine ligase n=1 Tax=Candidatus Enterococcus willemsii TaxID=1857215 RepID=A0ABQ6YXD3_9ENTE|nr:MULTISPECIES: D-alanine--D-serine ligase [Enterococcus]KAF1302535.1 D-alanine--D-serine ligase [Enterococcus sp. CU12B]MCD5002995.1 D-alanine--D-serine ligase [Enterococcus saccharolyticus]